MSTEETRLWSFHGDAELKACYVEKLRRHHEADELVQGEYWDKREGRGCAVGCTIEGSEHARYEEILGLPRWLAELEDTIFEGLPISEAKDFACDFLASIPVGSDLSCVRWQFQAAVMEENLRAVESLDIDAKPKDLVIKVITDVKALNDLAAAGETIHESQWAAVRAESAKYNHGLALATPVTPVSAVLSILTSTLGAADSWFRGITWTVAYSVNWRADDVVGLSDMAESWRKYAAILLGFLRAAPVESIVASPGFFYPRG